jgi:hypothetical protein
MSTSLRMTITFRILFLIIFVRQTETTFLERYCAIPTKNVKLYFIEIQYNVSQWPSSLRKGYGTYRKTTTPEKLQYFPNGGKRTSETVQWCTWYNGVVRCARFPVPLWRHSSCRALSGQNVCSGFCLWMSSSSHLFNISSRQKEHNAVHSKNKGTAGVLWRCKVPVGATNVYWYP